MDAEVSDPPPSTLTWALCFEIGLGVVALLLGKALGSWPVQTLHWPLPIGLIGFSICAAYPPLLLMLRLRKLRSPAISELNDFVEQHILPIFSQFSWLQLGLVSIAAGWGEELLFRGFIQADLTARIGPLAAILASSLLFGMMHPFSRTYFMLATATSIYLGWLFWQYETIWVPIIAHSLYDFLMLVVLTSGRKSMPRPSAVPPSGSRQP